MMCAKQAPRVHRLLLVVAAALTLTLEAEGAALRWVGPFSNNLWDNPANWDPTKIPQPDDDATLPPGSNVLIGSGRQATANSITLVAQPAPTGNATTLTILGTNLAIGGGGIVAHGNSVLIINNVGLTGSGNITMLDGSLFDFYGNYLRNNVTIGPGATMRFSGFASRGNGAGISVDGLLELRGGGEVYVSGVSISRTGRLLLNGSSFSVQVAWNDNLVSAPFGNGKGITVTNSPRGVTQLQGYCNNVIVNGGTLDVVSSPNTGSFGYLSLKNVTVNGSFSTTSLYMANSTASSVQCHDSRFEGDNHVDTLSANSLACQAFQSWPQQYHLRGRSITARGDSVYLANCSVEAKEVSLWSNLGANGPGTITAENITLQCAGIVNLLNYTATKAARVFGTCDFGSQVTIGPNAVADISGLVAFGRRGEGTWVNQGRTVVQPNQKAQLTWFTLVPQQQGTFAVGRNGSLDFQNINATLGEIHLDGPSSRFTGEGVGLGWSSLTGGTVGERIGITSDTTYSECASPCQGEAYSSRQQLVIEAR